MVTLNQVKRARNSGYSTLTITKRVENTVLAVYVQMTGIYGGKRNPDRRIKYGLYIDLSGFPRKTEVWIITPDFNQTKHINIYPPTRCPFFIDRELPRFCIGTLDRQMKEKSRMTLLFFLGGLKRVLNTQNWEDPARPH